MKGHSIILGVKSNWGKALCLKKCQGLPGSWEEDTDIFPRQRKLGVGYSLRKSNENFCFRCTKPEERLECQWQSPKGSRSLSHEERSRPPHLPPYDSVPISPNILENSLLLLHPVGLLLLWTPCLSTPCSQLLFFACALKARVSQGCIFSSLATLPPQTYLYSKNLNLNVNDSQICTTIPFLSSDLPQDTSIYLFYVTKHSPK